MKRAAENEEFVVYYQPKVDLPRKRCIGLKRLCAEDDGGPDDSADEFIRCLKKTDLLQSLIYMCLSGFAD